MSVEEEAPSPARIALTRFEADFSLNCRLEKYVRGRIRGFWLRQTLTAFGSLTIALFESPTQGLILALLALAGEGVELALFRRVRYWLAAPDGIARASRLVLVAAAVQSASISGCVFLVWTSTDVQEAHVFAMVFLIGAMINAGLPRSVWSAAVDLRLAIYVLAGTTALLSDHAESGFAISREFGYEAASFGLLCYVSFLFIRLHEHNQRQRRQNEHVLLRQQLDSESAASDLARTVEDMQRLALVAKYATDSILIGAPDGRILWVNDAFSTLTGYSFDEAVGSLPADLLNSPGTDPKTVERILEARRENAPVRAEILNRTKSGKSIWVETSIIPVFDDQRRPTTWIAVERDISFAKQREDELARARVAAEEAGQSKTRFLANMSHEIRTPMNGIIGVAELLSETKLSPTQMGYVETIVDSSRALWAVINDILDLARLQSGKTLLDLRPFSVRACVDGALKVLGPAAAKKGVALKVQGQPDGGFVLGDEGKLRQVVLNLVGNAIKFTHEGTVTLRLGLPAPGQSGVAIEVEDSGIGIAPDRVAAIFESFSQADSGIGRQFGGTGLGLTICAMLAEQMGGSISVKSELGKGSIFTFRADLPYVDAPREVLPMVDRRAEPRLRSGLRVLVAEDNRTNMMIVRKMLAALVKSFGEAQNGDEAVAIYRERPPELILMDVSMPLKDGLQATREIRAHERLKGLTPCIIIALTANAFGEDREACKAAGMDGFLTKPMSRLDLLTAIAGHFPERAQDARAIGL